MTIVGRAWLYHTLSEGSFESYLACMLRDNKTLKKQYFQHALVRDADRTNQLINLLAGLENVSFTLQLVSYNKADSEILYINTLSVTS